MQPPTFTARGGVHLAYCRDCLSGKSKSHHCKIIHKRGKQNSNNALNCLYCLKAYSTLWQLAGFSLMPANTEKNRTVEVLSKLVIFFKLNSYYIS